MDYNNILLDKEDGVAILSINRPKFLNALNKTTVEEISHAIDCLDVDDEVKVIILTGSGDKAFAAGGDIFYMQEMTVLEAREFCLFGQGVLRKLESLVKPVIGAINGYCLGGGCELAMACDFRIASSKAKFGQPEVSLGVIPGFGGTQRLGRLIGQSMAKQLLYTGEIIDAFEALRIGLVNSIVSDEKLLDKAKEIAKDIISKSQLAVRMCKTAINEGMQTDIDRAMVIEANIFSLSFATNDQKEGMKAFIEKRKPIFIEN